MQKNRKLQLIVLGLALFCLLSIWSVNPVDADDFCVTSSWWNGFGHPEDQTNPGVGLDGGGISVMAVYDDYLIVGGSLRLPGETDNRNIARWDGSNWSHFPVEITGSLELMTVYQENGRDALLVAGNSLEVNDVPFGRIAKWNGYNWDHVGGHLLGGPIAAITIHNNIPVLAMMGQVMTWTGSSWEQLGSHFYDPDQVSGMGAPLALLSLNGTLFVAGDFTSIGQVDTDNIAYWDESDESWKAFQPGHTTPIRQLVEHQGNMYMADRWVTQNPLTIHSRVHHLESNSWVLMSKAKSGFIAAIIVSGENVIIGGEFSEIGTLPAAHIACWDGNSFFQLGSGVDDKVFTLAIFKNKLYAGGQFSTTGDGMSSSRIAMWSALVGVACRVDVPSNNFGSVPVNVSEDLNFTIHNDGGNSFSGTLSSDSPEFTIIAPADRSFSLDAGQFQEITVRFTPVSIGDKSCTIKIETTSEANCQEQKFYGRGIESLADCCENLNDAYHQGAPGSGRTIYADEGDVEIQGPGGLTIIDPDNKKLRIGTYLQFPNVAPDGLTELSAIRFGAPNDGCEIISRQLQPDAYEFIFRMADNIIVDAFKIWFDEWRGEEYDRYPFEVRGDRVLLTQDGGNVGIGTTNPSEKLTVDSTLRIFGGSNDFWRIARRGIVLARENADACGRDTLNSPPDSIGIYFPAHANDYAVMYSNIHDRQTKLHLRVQDDYNDHIILEPSGNVGIGISDPVYKLDVNGDINVSGSYNVKKGGSDYDYPDHVFEADYKLMPLDELREYISQKKSLPNVVTSEDVKKNNGFKIDELIIQMLEKIEEQTLYIFELEERIEKLEKK